MSGIFLSYRRSDSSGVTGRIHDRLVAAFGKDQVFMDVDTIAPGENFVKAVEASVIATDVLVAVIGSDWASDATITGETAEYEIKDFVRLEIATALKIDKPVIPVLVGDASMPAPRDLPEDIRGLSFLNAVEIRHMKFHDDLQGLVEALEQYVQQPSRTPRSRPWSRGLWPVAAVLAIGGLTAVGIAVLKTTGSSGEDDGPGSAQVEELSADRVGDSTVDAADAPLQPGAVATNPTASQQPESSWITIGTRAAGPAELFVNNRSMGPLAGGAVAHTLRVPAGTVRLRYVIAGCQFSPFEETITVSPGETHMIGMILNEC